MLKTSTWTVSSLTPDNVQDVIGSWHHPVNQTSQTFFENGSVGVASVSIPTQNQLHEKRFNEMFNVHRPPPHKGTIFLA